MQHHSNASHDPRRAGRCRSHRLRFRCVPSDHTLVNDALAVLTASGHMREGRIQVTVRGGIIVLDGTVRWHSVRMDAGACIEDLPGLQGVCNRLNLEPSHQAVAHVDTHMANGKYIPSEEKRSPSLRPPVN